MTDIKKIKNWQSANESFSLSQQLRPKEQTVERSFTGASSLKPMSPASVTTSSVNSATAPTPKPSAPTPTR